MHELEALVGILLAVPDPNIQKVLGTLSRNDFAREILGKVSDSAFGPMAIQEYMQRFPNQS